MADSADLAALLSGGDDDQAEAAVMALAAQGPAALPVIKALLASPDVDLRWWGVRALAELPGEPASGLLVRALGDPEPAVRQCAALGLRKQPAPQAIPALVSALGDEDRLCATLAADTLASLGSEAVSALLAATQGDHSAARVEAVRALALIGDPRAIPALFAVLNDESALVEYWANQGLERMGVGMSFFKP
jgi:HEAT repeat protein